MTASNFDRALAAVLVHEGGWADNPKDPGGATMKGVTIATYRRYYPGATKDDLRNITNAQLQRIYRTGYWNKVKGDDLPSGLDYAVFDFAVNSGVSRAAKFLQNALNVAADGKIGPVTLAAVAKDDPTELIKDVCDMRLAWLKGLGTWKTFGNGWAARVSGVKGLALQMAAILPPAIPQPPDLHTEPPEEVGQPVIKPDTEGSSEPFFMRVIRFFISLFQKG